MTEAGVGARLSRQDIVDAYDRLGSVRAAAAALGINARTVRVHLQGAGQPAPDGVGGPPGPAAAVLAVVAQRYADGLNLKQIAAEVGMSASGVAYQLERLGVHTPRRRARRPRAASDAASSR